MKKVIMCLIGAMMILSLTACTPTTEKKKTGEVKQTEAVKSTAPAKNPDPTAPELDVVSVYTVSADGSKLEGTMDAVDELNAQALVDLLIQYGVLAEGTEAVSFDAEGEPSSEAVGPGVVKVPGAETGNTTKEYGTLELNQVPDSKDDMMLQAVANTFIENMDVAYLTIKVDGETVGENMTMVEAGK